MPKQLNLINVEAALSALPSAKVKKGDKAGVHGWTDFYASFSASFVSKALEAMGGVREAVVYDPFVGSGTTLVSASKMGLSVVAADIDPFACLLSRAKIAVSANPRVVRSILAPKKTENGVAKFSTDAAMVFSGYCLSYAASVFCELTKRTGLNSREILSTFLADSEGRFDSEVIALAILSIAASDSARLIKGSNPTWLRRAEATEQVPVSSLKLSVEKTFLKVFSSLAELKQSAVRRNAIIVNVDSRIESGIKVDAFADFVVTSPPYLTRIDYAVKHLPNLLILSGLIDIDVDSLRSRMIGTSRIVNKRESEADFGAAVSRAISSVYNHSSYASARYYRWIYQQYFFGMRSAVATLSKSMKSSGKGVIVVQDAYYKDQFINLSEIIVELLSQFSLIGQVVRAEPVKTNLRQLNPTRSRSHLMAKESVVYFEKLYS